MDRAHDLDIVPGVGIYVMGWTKSPGFDGAVGGILPQLRGGTDIFISRFHNNIDLDQSTYIGSVGNDEIVGNGLAIAKDTSQAEDKWYAFVTGTISSTGLTGVTDETAFQPAYNGGYDVLFSYMNADLKPDPTPDIEVQPRQLDFKNVRLNTASVPQGLILENIGGTSLTISSITILGEGAADFTLDLTSEDTSCGDVFPKNIEKSSTCKVNVIFTPSIDNVMRTAMVRIAVANDPDEPIIDVTLKGYSGPDIDEDPMITNLIATGVTELATDIWSHDLNFGSVAVGNSRSLPLLVSSTGSEPLEISGISFSDPGNFLYFPDSGNIPCGNLPINIAGTSFCTMKAIFRPLGAGIFDETMTFVSNDPDEASLTIHFTGTGVSDTDHDGIPDVVESRDGNNDGTMDSEQSHVASFQTFYNSHAIVIELESDAYSLTEITTTQ